MNKKVITALSKKDKTLKKAIQKYTLDDLPPANNDIYFSLIRSIVYQQLSGKAAGTILARFLAIFKDGYPTPNSVIRRKITTLRSLGLSNQKAGYIQNVARFFLKEKLADKDWSAMSDEAIIEYLTQIKGVGIWTVQMILMFSLHRPDVFPIDDLGVKNGMIELYGLTETKKELRSKLIEISDGWKPYRSTGSRYMWKWKDEE